MQFNPLDYPIIFSSPRRFTEVVSWHGLIPAAFALIALHRPRVFVELGTHKGDSYCTFCQAVEELNLATRCYAVDSWKGDQHAGFYSTDIYDELRLYHDPLYGHFSTLLPMTFDNALSQFSDGEIDLLHIDGMHTYDAVKHDFDHWLPKMGSRGIILLHDTTPREDGFGVYRLWEELSSGSYPTRLFTFSNGLGIVVVGEEALDGPLGSWFAGGKGEWPQIHNLFAALGKERMSCDRIVNLQARFDWKQDELAKAAAQIDREQTEWRHWKGEKSREIEELIEHRREKSREIDQLHKTLENKEKKLTQANNAQHLEQLRRETVEQTLGIIGESWPWRWFARYLVPGHSLIIDTRGAAGLKKLQSSSMTLETLSPLLLPENIWPGAGRSFGGIRYFVQPVTIWGDRIELNGARLCTGREHGRLLVLLNQPVLNLKFILNFNQNGTTIPVTLELGQLKDQLWCPIVRQSIQVSPKRPAVLHMHLSTPLSVLAITFAPHTCVLLSQIAVIAISPMERVLHPLLKPLTYTRGIFPDLRQSFSRVQHTLKHHGWREAANILRKKPESPQDDSPQLSVENTKAPASSNGDPYTYMEIDTMVNFNGKRIAVLCSSLGNFFMGEIGKSIALGAEKLGARVITGDENSRIDLSRCDSILVVAPHEFFILGKGIKAFAEFVRHGERLFLLNTEQPQTQWFDTAAKFFHGARVVLDINYQTSLHLREMGIHAYFFPIGYNSENKSSGQVLPEHPAFEYLPRALFERAPERYRDRPIDIVFVGTASPRRKSFFARHAQFFSGLNAFIYLPDGNHPFVQNNIRTLDFATMAGLIRRTKIFLNIHRDEDNYLEWQRLVNLGIFQGTLVISEQSDFCPAISANGDYIDVPLELIPAACTCYLDNPALAEDFALQASGRLSKDLPMEKIIARLSAAL